MRRINEQSVVSRLEVVISARPECIAELCEIPSGKLANIRVVPANFATSARARISAIREASAPIIIFAEDHAFPVGQDWAERLIAQLSRTHSGVGPVMRNANPDTALSWANFIVEYGAWLQSDESETVKTLPGHNSAYRRDVLLAYGDALAEMLEAEWVMHNDMRSRGLILKLDPNVKIEHLNYSRLDSALRLQFLAGWMFAASRSANWSLARRGFYSLSFPAIAIVRFFRALGQMHRSTYAKPEIARTLPYMAVLLIVSAVGEGIGYAFGDCGKRSSLGLLEYERWRHLSTCDIGLMMETK